ncbi:acyl-CoA dehydrogenase [Nocardia sp. NPDC127526]|uniref:acyl-CoA dehydrogenase n=1 Tax=Nocardia sp. NPDC127526 TaxID=3345393 RepID=UPI003637A62B
MRRIGLPDHSAPGYYPDALSLAEAHCAEEALQLLHQHADHAEIAAVRDVFALHYLDQHAAWYLTRGLLDIAGVTAIKQQLRAAIDTLATHLPQVLDAFELNDEILGAPVLSEDLPAAWDARCTPAAS